MKLFQHKNVTPWMESNQPLSRDVLHEDLQILRYTLAAILDDVRMRSPLSANAVEQAIQDLDRARNALDDEEGNRLAADRHIDPSSVCDHRAKKQRARVLSPVSASA